MPACPTASPVTHHFCRSFTIATLLLPLCSCVCLSVPVYASRFVCMPVCLHDSPHNLPAERLFAWLLNAIKECQQLREWFQLFCRCSEEILRSVFVYTRSTNCTPEFTLPYKWRLTLVSLCSALSFLVLIREWTYSAEYLLKICTFAPEIDQCIVCFDYFIRL